MNKKLIYILLIPILMFINMSEGYAEDKYTFYLKNFSTQTKLNEFAEKVCSITLEEPSRWCHFKMSGNNAELKTDYVTAEAYGLIIEVTLPNITSIDELKEELENRGVDTLIYEDYCKNGTKDFEVCEAVKKTTTSVKPDDNNGASEEKVTYKISGEAGFFNSSVVDGVCKDDEGILCSFKCPSVKLAVPGYLNGNSACGYDNWSELTEISFTMTKNGLIDHLMNNNCGKSSKCFEWLTKNYCNTKSDDLCKAIKSAETENTCYYSFNTKNSGEISFEVNIKNKDVYFNYAGTTPTDYISSHGDYFEGKSVGDYIYFYSKAQTFEELKKTFLDSYNSSISPNKCPNLCFCKEKSDNPNKWYTTFDKSSCDGGYGTGIYQCSSNGINNGIMYTEAPEFDKLIGSANTVNVCSDLIVADGDLQKLLKGLVNIVKVLIPIALLALGILDFAQSIFSGNEDGMKKAQGKFIKRLLIAVIIFLIPSILGLLLTIANSIWPVISPDLCGIL